MDRTRDRDNTEITVDDIHIEKYSEKYYGVPWPIAKLIPPQRRRHDETRETSQFLFFQRLQTYTRMLRAYVRSVLQ